MSLSLTVGFVFFVVCNYRDRITGVLAHPPAVHEHYRQTVDDLKYTVAAFGDNKNIFSPQDGQRAATPTRAFSSEVDTGSREETRQNKRLVPGSDSIRTDKALAVAITHAGGDRFRKGSTNLLPVSPPGFMPGGLFLFQAVLFQVVLSCPGEDCQDAIGDVDSNDL